MSGVGIWAGATGNIEGGTTAAERNVLSGNHWDGAAVGGVGSTGNVVQGNYVGTDPSGTLAVGNAKGGISISGGGRNNTVGGTTPGAGNLVSANVNGGVVLANAGTSENFVQGNRIGTDWTGTRALGNIYDGLVVFGGASGNTIGGTAPGAGNQISGNGSDGVDMTGLGSGGNVLLGNRIGTDPTGSWALGNGHRGVAFYLAASGNTIGGTAPGAGNLISGNG